MSVGGWDRKADREAEGRNVILEECIFIGFSLPQECMIVRTGGGRGSRRK